VWCECLVDGAKRAVARLLSEGVIERREVVHLVARACIDQQCAAALALHPDFH